jgi:Kdo2-lipid IVA lauroyltransferase/acyltransferase
MNRSLSIFDKIKLLPLWIISLLPLPVLYLASDLLFIIIFYLVSYRTGIVYKNLKNSFPEKESKEINDISRRFYRYLCDYFMESIYLLNMKPSECNRRYRFTNPELLEELASRKKNIILATCHYGNWEWANNLNNLLPYKILGVYKPLSNKLFDRLFIHIRGRYGSLPIAMKQTLREILKALEEKELFALYLVADQRPSGNELQFWTTFFNQDAPVITGMEKLSHRFDLPIVFLLVRRVRRGYYQIAFELLVDDPGSYLPHEITKKYIRKVEQLVKQQPEYYLWSHNRWKYAPEKNKLMETA